MSIENGIDTYTHEDVRLIAGGDDGFSFRGPEEHDPLGQLFAEIQSGFLLVDHLTSQAQPECAPKRIATSDAPSNIVPQGVEVEL